MIEYPAVKVNCMEKNLSISFYVMVCDAGGRPMPPDPGEQVPSVSPVGKTDGAPFRYGGFRAASGAHYDDHIS